MNTGQTAPSTSASDDVLLAAEDVKMHFPLRGGLLRTVKGHVMAVDGVSLKLRRGETLAVVGESGCGKSTLARLLLRLLDPSGGKVFFMGHDLASEKLRVIREERKHLQMVFQDPMSSLDPRMTVKNIIAEPLVVHQKAESRPLSIAILSALMALAGAFAIASAILLFVLAGLLSLLGIVSLGVIGGALYEVTIGGIILLTAVGLWRVQSWAWWSALVLYAANFILAIAVFFSPIQMAESAIFVGVLFAVRKHFMGGEAVTQRVLELLELVGLKKEHLNRFPHEFSGGQRQRINVARALALNPDVIILDEPTSALDVSVQAQILNLLMSLQKRLGLTYLFITHDLSVVYHIADRVAVMYAGKIVELGETEYIFREPLHPYTKALISAAPSADPRVAVERIILEGEVPSPTHPPSGCRFHPRCWLAFEPCLTNEPPLFDAGNGRRVACFAAASDLGLESLGGPEAASKKAAT
jgi:peptide/nickel transport system ATP-binding protein